ncbi:MAG: 50S ribosomal protein L27 [Candidatus Pacebacteria bacterium]|nr:50S ribosomal protein L27 [Candidatus Paceibacterota bacterium]
MATTKSAGTTKLGRSSQPKYLGVKLFSGQKAKSGSIIVKQRGKRYVPGKNTKIGSDDTIYAVCQGIINFKTTKKRCFNGSQKIIKIVNVLPE